MISDTVFALASGGGKSAIAVIRISGSASGDALQSICGRLPRPREAVLRRLRHPGDGELLDRALVLWFPAPRSYTGEDCAELHLHGGRSVLAGVADALVAAGLRPAEPGEFTRRAFLHGKIDLGAAEGVLDLIEAETAAQRRQALRQADGALAAAHRDWEGRMTRLLARQEALIEFEDEELPGALAEEVLAETRALLETLERQLRESARSERLREGLAVAIVGAPNAGKSSLLNALAGREAAIVSARAGTTRDIVEVRLDLGGVPVTLADTAGLHESEDEVEAEGVRRAVRRAAQADLRIVVFAADRAPDEASLGQIGTGSRNALVVASKSDLQVPPATIGGARALAVSAQSGLGLAALRDELLAFARMAAGVTSDIALTRPRHRAAVLEAIDWLKAATTAPLPEVRAHALREAREALARLTGGGGVEAVLDAIFGEFCIGK